MLSEPVHTVPRHIVTLDASVPGPRRHLPQYYYLLLCAAMVYAACVARPEHFGSSLQVRPSTEWWWCRGGTHKYTRLVGRTSARNVAEGLCCGPSRGGRFKKKVWADARYGRHRALPTTRLPGASPSSAGREAKQGKKEGCVWLASAVPQTTPAAGGHRQPRRATRRLH